MGAGSVSGTEFGLIQSQYMNNIYVYDCSRLNGTQVGKITEEKENYKLVSSTELSTNNVYIQNDKIIEIEEDEEGNQVQKVVGNEGLNFGKVRYDYQNGYFPTLKTSYSANLFWGSGNLNISQKKIPIPNRVAEFSEDDEISIEENVASVAMLSLFNEEELPDVDIYAVDVDKINIEFNEITPNTKFKITSNDETIMPLSNIEKQVYTLNYDFSTDLTLTVSNLDYSYQKEITKENVQSSLDIIQDEYLYLQENTVI